MGTELRGLRSTDARLLKRSTARSPVLDFPREVRAGQLLVLDAAHSAGDIVEYRSDFGDGSTSTGRGNAIAHYWEKPGKYKISLSVKDSSDWTARFEKAVIVAKQ